MKELKKNVIDVLNQINQDWVESLKEAYEEERRVSSTEMMGKFSQNMQLLMQHFGDAEERCRKKGTKRFLL